MNNTLSSNVERIYISNKNYYYKVVNKRNIRISKKEYELINRNTNYNNIFNTQKQEHNNFINNNDDYENNTKIGGDFGTTIGVGTGIALSVVLTGVVRQLYLKHKAEIDSDDSIRRKLFNKYDDSISVQTNYFSKSLDMDETFSDEDEHNKFKIIKYKKDNHYNTDGELLFERNKQYLFFDYHFNENYTENAQNYIELYKSLNILNNYEDLLKLEHEYLNIFLDISISHDKLYTYYDFNTNLENLEKSFKTRFDNQNKLIDRLLLLHDNIISALNHLQKEKLYILNLSCNSIIYDSEKNCFLITNFEDVRKGNNEDVREGNNEDIYNDITDPNKIRPMLKNIHFLSFELLKRVKNDKSFYVKFKTEQLFSLGSLLYRIIFCEKNDEYNGIQESFIDPPKYNLIFTSNPINSDSSNVNRNYKYLNYLQNYIPENNNNLIDIITKLRNFNSSSSDFNNHILNCLIQNFEIDRQDVAIDDTHIKYLKEYLNKISFYLNNADDNYTKIL